MKPIRRILLALGLLVPAAPAQQPLPFLHPNDLILFQGDSITDGGRQRTGNDYNHIMGQDYAYLLAAQLGLDYPAHNLTFLNRGIGSEQVRDFVPRWQADVLDLHPNLLSILVGVNDTLMSGDRAETPEQYEATYDTLLARTLAALPGVKIILGEPFLLPVGKHQPTYTADMQELRKRQAAVRRLAAKHHLPLIPYQQAFDRASQLAPADHWSWDGIHPTYAGHALMAREWLRTAQAFWPKASS